jgi:alpha-beta hydrolase superfamily lysophospholipase
MASVRDDVLQASHGEYHVHVWENPHARYVVLLAHGLGEHARRYDHVADALVSDGAVVYAPDHYGHGRSAGARALVEDVEASVDDLHDVVAARAVDAFPKLPVMLIGHSLGGVIATRYAQRFMPSLAALVLSGPVIGGNPAFEPLLAMDPMPEVPLDPAALSRDPAVGEAYAADPLVYHGPLLRGTLEGIFAAVQTIAAGPALTLPTLWIHGENDPLAPYDATRDAVEALRTDLVEEKVYPGAMHEIFNETNRDQVIADVLAFINRHV